MSAYEWAALLAALAVLGLTFVVASLVAAALERRRDRDAAYRRLLAGGWQR